MVLEATGLKDRQRVRSMVGLIPLFAVEVLDASVFARLPGFSACMHWFLRRRPHLVQLALAEPVPAE